MNIKAISAFLLFFITLVFSVSGQIGSPIYDKPADKSTDISTSPLLQLKTLWSAIPEYQVDSVSTFNSPALQHLFGLPSKKENARAYFLDFNKKYFWRARISLDGDTSAWGSAWTFTTVTAPVLYYPANNSYLGAETIGWNSSGAQLYKVELDTTLYFNSLFLQKYDIKDSTLTNTVVYATPGKLLYGKKHYWRVKAMHINDTSDWSAAWSFTMPAKTTLYNPADNSVLNNAETKLEWHENRGSHFYHVQYDTTADFNSAVRFDSIVPATKFSYNSLNVKDLHFGKKHFWRIRAVNSGDSSDWSEVWTFTTVTTVKLNSPFNNSTTVDVNESHRWSGINPGNNIYEIQIDSTTDFNSPHLFSATTANSSLAPTGRLFGTKYYWRVRVMHAKDTAVWSNVGYYTTKQPVKPTILSPNNNAQNQPLENTVQWDARGVLKSIIQLDTNADFSAPFLIDTFNNVNNLSFPSIKVKELSFNQKIYLRIRNYLDVDSTAWSNTYNFTTVARPELEFPYHEMPNFGTETNIVAKPIIGATHYMWELDTSANFNSPAIRNGISTNATVDPGGEFYFGKWYYWRFKAAHAKDTSEWSVTRKFQSTVTVFPFLPANNAVLSTNTPTFDWGGISGATGYQYLLSTDSVFTNVKPVTLMGQANTHPVISVSYASTYYWKVRAFHAKDTSAWSERRMFKVNPAPVVPVPVLLAPANNATNVKSGQVQFFWSANGAAVSSYDFELDYTNSFSSPVVSGTNLTNAFASISGIKETQDYYWRVRTWSGNHVSKWSNPFKFTTETLTGIGEEFAGNLSNTITVFPIPATGSFTIKLQNNQNNNQLKEFSLMDANGKTWKQEFNLQAADEYKIDVANLPAGLYFIRLQFNDTIEVIKVVLQ